MFEYMPVCVCVLYYTYTHIGSMVSDTETERQGKK